MENVTIKQLMTLERILLEINTKYKFELEFSDAYNLYESLKEIGKITNYFFLLQDEFRQANNDLEKLKEYHNKLMESEVDYNHVETINLIDTLKEYLNKEELNELVNKLKFW